MIFHGVFSPNSRLRKQIIQAERIRHVLGTAVEASFNGAAIRIEIEMAYSNK